MAVRLVRAYLNGYWPLLSALLIVVVAGLKAQQARNPSTRLKPLDHWKPWFCPVTVCLLTSFDSCYKLIQLRDPHRRRHWSIGFWEPVCRRSEGCRCNLSGGIVASLRLSLIERDSRHIGEADSWHKLPCSVFLYLRVWLIWQPLCWSCTCDLNCRDLCCSMFESLAFCKLETKLRFTQTC